MAVGRVRTRLFALGVLAMSTHRAVVVRADDTLNGPVSEAFGKSAGFNRSHLGALRYKL